MWHDGSGRELHGGNEQRRCATGVLLCLAMAVLFGQATRAIGQEAGGAPDTIGEVTLFGDEEIKIVSTTKTEIPISKSPGAVTVVTSRQIRESGARTIPELMRLVAGVNVRWNPMVQTIDIRGFGQNPFTNRVLLLIDGVPYNDWNQGGFPVQPGLDFFVLQNIKQIEVVRGPGSALYGENAYWGVINIITLSGADLRGGRMDGFTGDRSTGSLGVSYGQVFGDASVLVAAKYLQSQYPMSYWTDQTDARVRNTDTYFKAGWKGLQLSYYRHSDHADEWTISEPLLGPTAVIRASETRQDVDIVAAKYDFKTKGGGFSFGSDVSYARRNGTHCIACHARLYSDHSTEKSDHGYLAIGDFRVGIHSLPANDILVGVESRRVDAGEHTDELLSPDSGQEVHTHYHKLAAYAQDQLSLFGDKMRLVGGFRYDGATDQFHSELSPRLAAVFNPSAAMVLRAGWSKAFRFPNFSELYQNTWFLSAELPPNVAIPLVLFEPNPDLEPEQIQTVDAGAEYRLSSNLSAKVDLFWSQVKEFMVIAIAIFPLPTPATLRYENHPGTANIYGGETELRWTMQKSVTGFLSYAYQTQSQDGDETDSTGQKLEFVYAPKHKVTLGSYFGPFAGLSGSVELMWRDKVVGPAAYYLVNSDFQDPTIRPLDDPIYLNMRASYDVPVGSGALERPLRLTLYGMNMLNQRETQTLTGVDTRVAGREYFLELGYSF
ncbi:MAG: TonB-dependent receptor [Candidatus Schekmanbacteria bacterium]|nr:TonB-dependent receptor [Candidatus Schekmanbacteria bacterium]